MKDKSIMEVLEHEFKTGEMTSQFFKERIDMFKKDKLYRSYSPVSTYHQLDLESSFDYSLFKLYCFFNYSIEDIYNLLKELNSKYFKCELYLLNYSEFYEYTRVLEFKERKKYYLKSQDEYKNKVKAAEEVKSGNVVNLCDDYNDTTSIINCLNDDMKDICNNEDIPAEKRIDYINKYSKISIRLHEKRSSLYDEINRVIL